MENNTKNVVNTFIERGLKKRELGTILASNSVVDWFGRTIKGRQNIVNFFLNSNVSYEHIFTSVESTQAFEDRRSHMTTRQNPSENLIRTSGTETNLESSPSLQQKSLDCTPTQKSSCAVKTCPPAPNRIVNPMICSSDSDDSNNSDDLNLSGIQPIDKSFDSRLNSPKSKKRKIEKTRRSSLIIEEHSELSSHTTLKYLKANGSVGSDRQTSDNSDKRECCLLMSYREKIDDVNDVQIALMIYKPNSRNLKSRRNLLTEFEVKSKGESSTKKISNKNDQHRPSDAKMSLRF